MSSILSDALESCQTSPGSLLSPSLVNTLQDGVNMDSPRSIPSPVNSGASHSTISNSWLRKQSENIGRDISKSIIDASPDANSPCSSVASKASSVSAGSNQDSSKLLRRLLAGADKDNVRNCSDLLTRCISNSSLKTSNLSKLQQSNLKYGRLRASTVAGDTDENAYRYNSDQVTNHTSAFETLSSKSDSLKVIASKPERTLFNNLSLQNEASQNFNFLTSRILNTIEKISSRSQNLNLDVTLSNDIKTLLEMLRLADSLGQAAPQSIEQPAFENVHLQKSPVNKVDDKTSNKSLLQAQLTGVRTELTSQANFSQTIPASPSLKKLHRQDYIDARLRSHSEKCLSNNLTQMDDVEEDSLLAKLVLNPEDEKQLVVRQETNNNNIKSKCDGKMNRPTSMMDQSEWGRYSSCQPDYPANKVNIDRVENPLKKCLQLSAQQSGKILLSIDRFISCKTVHIPPATLFNISFPKKCNLYNCNQHPPHLIRFIRRCWPPLFLLELLRDEHPIQAIVELNTSTVLNEGKLICHFDQVPESVSRNFTELTYFAKQLNLHKDVYNKIAELILSQFGNPEYFELPYVKCVDNIRENFAHRTDSSGALCDVLLLVNRLNSFDEGDVKSLFNINEQNLALGDLFDKQKLEQAVTQMIMNSSSLGVTSTTSSHPQSVSNPQTSLDSTLSQFLSNAASYMNQSFNGTPVSPIAQQLNVLNLSALPNLYNSDTFRSSTSSSGVSSANSNFSSNLDYLLSTAAAVVGKTSTANLNTKTSLSSSCAYPYKSNSEKSGASSSSEMMQKIHQMKSTPFPTALIQPPKLTGTLHNNILQIMQNQLQQQSQQINTPNRFSSDDQVGVALYASGKPSCSQDDKTTQDDSQLVNLKDNANFTLHPRKRKAPQLDSSINGRPRSATYNGSNMM